MTKRAAALKRPQGRPPAGSVLVDGKWQLTDRSKEIARERLLRHRDLNRARRQQTRELLRRECPELFALVRFLKLHVIGVTAVSLAQSEQANSMHQRTQHVYGENSVAAHFRHICSEFPEFLGECAHSP